jgi:hypothetical protein
MILSITEQKYIDICELSVQDRKYEITGIYHNSFIYTNYFYV